MTLPLLIRRGCPSELLHHSRSELFSRRGRVTADRRDGHRCHQPQPLAMVHCGPAVGGASVIRSVFPADLKATMTGRSRWSGTLASGRRTYYEGVARSIKLLAEACGLAPNSVCDPEIRKAAAPRMRTPPRGSQADKGSFEHIQPPNRGHNLHEIVHRTFFEHHQKRSGLIHLDASGSESALTGGCA